MIYVVYAYHVGFSGRERWKVYGVEGLIRRLRVSVPSRLGFVASIPSHLFPSCPPQAVLIWWPLRFPPLSLPHLSAFISVVVGVVS